MKKINKINYDLIKSPLVTEKSTILSESGKYVFKVANSADKDSIRASIEKIFEVKVKSVDTLIQKGKVKRFKGRLGVRAAVKKAIVTLQKDYNIDLAGGVK